MTNRELRAQGLPHNLPTSHVAARMVITVMRDGRTSVTGPLGNKKLCMAILNDAANVINQFNPQSEEQEQKPDAAIIVPDSKIILPS